MSKKTSAHNKGLFQSYSKDQTWKTNRLAKLEKHLVKHPEDDIAKAALKATDRATAPRRAGYKTNNPMKASGHLGRQLDRLVRKDAKALQYDKSHTSKPVIKA